MKSYRKRYSKEALERCERQETWLHDDTLAWDLLEARKVIEFYGSDANWEFPKGIIKQDGGQRAREYLEGVEK